MVLAEQPALTTRLQARIDAQDERIQSLSNDMNSLSTTVTSIQETLKSLPDSMEKLISHLFTHHQKQPLVSSDDGSIHHHASGSGPTPLGGTHRLFFDDQSADPLFSLPKVKLPLFDGVDPRGWITKAELYFQVHTTPAPVKMQLVQMCMDGAALNWFTNLLYKHPHTSWDQFRNKLMIRFSGTRFLNAYEALGSLNQDGDVEEYIEQFEALSALIPDQSEAQSIGMFLRGLHGDIKNWVRILNPATCDEAMDAARRVELATGNFDEAADDGGGLSGSTTRYTQAQSQRKYLRDAGPKFHRPTYLDFPVPQPNAPNSHLHHPVGTHTGLPGAAINPNRNARSRHLSKHEWEDRRRRGLCFGCGDKYSPPAQMCRWWSARHASGRRGICRRQW